MESSTLPEGTSATLTQRVTLLADVRAERLVPVHRGAFDLAEEPIEEPSKGLEAEARRLGLGPDRIWVLKHGETRRW